jgi:hypothetical protein
MLRTALAAALICAAAFPQVHPCPPKRYACWQVRVAAASFGAGALEAHASACGWSEAEIERTRRCIR